MRSVEFLRNIQLTKFFEFKSTVSNLKWLNCANAEHLAFAPLHCTARLLQLPSFLLNKEGALNVWFSVANVNW